nr:hypothetical protein [Tanacetum cinerariifolium]
VYDKIQRAVDLATAKDHHQHLKRSELQETTSISAGVTIAAGDPIPAVTSVSAGFSIYATSSIPAATLITAGVSTTAGASGSAKIDRDPSGNNLTTAIQLIQSLLNQLNSAA